MLLVAYAPIAARRNSSVLQGLCETDADAALYSLGLLPDCGPIAGKKRMAAGGFDMNGKSKDAQKGGKCGAPCCVCAHRGTT